MYSVFHSRPVKSGHVSKVHIWYMFILIHYIEWNSNQTIHKRSRILKIPNTEILNYHHRRPHSLNESRISSRPGATCSRSPQFQRYTPLGTVDPFSRRHRWRLRNRRWWSWLPCVPLLLFHLHSDLARLDSIWWLHYFLKMLKSFQVLYLNQKMSNKEENPEK